jgi:hypothetical protein
MFILGSLTTYETVVMPFCSAAIESSWNLSRVKELIMHALFLSG